MNIIVTCPRYFSEIEILKSKISNNYKINYLPPKDQGFSADEMKTNLFDANIAIIGDDQINDDVLSNCTELGLLIKWGVGIDNIEIENKEIYPKLTILNSPADIYIDVAEHIIFLIGSLYKKISIIDYNLRATSSWSKPIGNRLAKKNIGIIGYGMVGKQVAKLLNSFDTNIHFYDPNVDTENVEYAAKQNLEYIQKKCEVIIISSPLNKQTYQLINKSFFNSLKKVPIIINISRGKIINEIDLIDALENKLISGCALDVFEIEPLEKNNKLKNFENVILSSHNASNTIEANNAVNSQVTEILLKWIDNAR